MCPFAARYTFHMVPSTRKLSARQERFAAELAVNPIIHKAAVAVGYSPSYARGHAVDLARDSRIQQRISEIQAAQAIRTDFTVAAWRAKALELLARYENTNPSAAVKLLELLGRHLGALQTDQQSEGGKQMLAYLGAWAAGKLDAGQSETPVIEARVTEVPQA